MIVVQQMAEIDILILFVKFKKTIVSFFLILKSWKNEQIIKKHNLESYYLKI